MPIDAELLQVLEHLPDLIHVGFFEDGGIRKHLEAAGLGRPDAVDGFLENALALYRNIVVLLHAVQVDIEDQTGGRLEIFQALAEEPTVGAQLDVTAALE